jgi:hypothetical protein
MPYTSRQDRMSLSKDGERSRRSIRSYCVVSLLRGYDPAGAVLKLYCNIDTLCSWKFKCAGMIFGPLARIDEAIAYLTGVTLKSSTVTGDIV